MGNWTLVWGTTFIRWLFMTSEAMNNELHASDSSFLSFQNTRLGREGPPALLSSNTQTCTGTSILWAKQIHQNLNKHPSQNKICTNTKKKKKNQRREIKVHCEKWLSCLFLCNFSSRYKWAATRSAQIQMQSDSFLEHTQRYIHLAHHGLNCHWQSPVVAPSFLDMIWIGFM